VGDQLERPWTLWNTDQLSARGIDSQVTAIYNTGDCVGGGRARLIGESNGPLLVTSARWLAVQEISNEIGCLYFVVGESAR